MNSIEDTIRACNWFKDVPESCYELLVKSARVKQYDDKKYLYRLGEQGNFVYAIVSGFVRIKISSLHGQEFAITEFSTSDWLGEFSLTEQPERMFEAQVLENSTILEIPKRVIKTLADQYPIIYKNLFLQQSERTSKMCELLGGMLFYPLKARLAGRLMWFAHNYGEETEHGTLINKKMSQQELADLTMGSRQRVNKALKAWQDSDILSMQDQRYLIKDIELLRQETRINSED
jgi:CRP/FNR family cyclic AMP-dependent transcriptional regulator